MIPERATLPGFIALCLAVFFADPFGPPNLEAEELAATAPTPPPPHRELWVPTEHLDAVLASRPRAVMLTPEQYRTLLRDAMKGTADPRAEIAPPISAAIKEARIEGVLGEQVVSMTARYLVESFSDEWQEIPLSLPIDQLGQITVDDQSALRVVPPAEGKAPSPVLAIRGKGEHRVEVRYHLKVTRSPSGNAIQVQGPGVAASSLVLHHPEGVKFTSELPFRPIEAGAPAKAGSLTNRATEFVIPETSGAAFEIGWTARAIAAIPDAAIFQTCQYLYSIDSTRIQADLGLVLSSSLADLPEQFSISVPSGVRVLSIEGSELLRWTRNADAGSLSIDLVPGKRQAADLRILAEADVPNPEAGGQDIRIVLPIAEIEGVHRASGTIAILGSDDVRVKNIATGPLTVAAPEAIAPALVQLPEFVTGFQFPVTTEAPEVTLSSMQDRFNAQLDTHIELKRETIHLSRQLSLTALEGRLFTTELQLPAGEELVSVEPAVDNTAGSVGFSWNQLEGNRIRLLWQAGLSTGETTSLTVVSRRDPTDWFRLGESPVSLNFENAEIADAEAVSGYVAVAFDESFRVETVDATNLEPRDGRTTPVVGTLAWFRLSDYDLELSVARRPTEIEATVTAYALPLQSTLEIEGQLDLDIRYTPISEIVVGVDPEIAPQLRFDSPLLAERRLDEESGQWTLAFHDEQLGFHRLRFRIALPFLMEGSDEGTEGPKHFSVAAPALRIPAAKRLSGDWVIEANTDTELSFEANGLDAVDSLRVPQVAGYQPRHRVIAAFRYRGDQWDLEIAGTRHLAEELVTTVVDSLEIDTVISTDGNDRHQAVLQLRTSGEQFLEVGLPKGAQVWTLTVDGVAVKPVRADPGTLRVQLPARESADPTPIVLKFVYQTPGKPWKGSGSETLQPVRIASRIPITRSQWRLHLPEGFDYQRFRSNLKESFDVVDRTLLGQAWRERDRFLPDPPTIGLVALAESAGSSYLDRPAATPEDEAMPASDAFFATDNALLGPKGQLGAMMKNSVKTTSAPPKPSSAPVGDDFSGEASEASVESPGVPDSGLVTQAYTVAPGLFADVTREENVRLDADPFAAASTQEKESIRGASSPATAEIHQNAKDILENYGITFQHGAAATYNSETGQLIVRNTQDQIDLFEDRIQGLSEDRRRTAGIAGMPAQELPSTGTVRALEVNGIANVESGVDVLVDSETGESIVIGQATGGMAVPHYQSIGGGGGGLTALGITDGTELMIDQLDLQGMPLAEAVSVLGSKVRELAGNHPNETTAEAQAANSSLQLYLEADSDTAQALVNLSLRNVTLGEALARITADTNTEFRATASGVVIAQPSPLSPDRLATLVLELPNSAFERSGGDGNPQRQSARSLLTGAGIDFPPGTSAAYNFSTGRLAVRNTPDALDQVRAVFSEYLDYRIDLNLEPEVVNFEGFANYGSVVNASGKGAYLKGFDARNAGLIPIDFVLPESGRSYLFTGLYAPESLRFRYVNWERQVRFAWIWMLAGGLSFWFGAYRRLRRPVFVGLLGVLSLTFVPLVISKGLLAFCNSLLIGWLAAALLWFLWRLCDRLSRKPIGESTSDSSLATSPAEPTS